jgi:hypothetical protein
MLADEPDAPRKRLAPAAGEARLDQRVEHAAVLEPEPGHDRNPEGGEKLHDTAAAGAVPDPLRR